MDMWPDGVVLTCPTTVGPLDNSSAAGVLWQARRGAFRLEVPDVATYLVTDGAHIAIDPRGAKDEVERFLRATPLAALYLQRGVPILHAAAVVAPEGAIVIAGDSSTGKSVLAAALARRGWQVINDDLVPITLDTAGRAVVLPTAQSVRLWPDSMSRVPPPPPADKASEPIGVAMVWWLGTHASDDIEVVDISGVARVEAIAAMAYNSRLASTLLDRSAYLRVNAQLSAPVRRLLRPRGRWSADELADLVTESLTCPRRALPADE